jgi:hypothetical protein
MNTFLNHLGIAVVFVLFLAPVLIGIARDRRIDRQLREAERDRRAEPPEPPPAPPRLWAAPRPDLRIGART